MPLDHVAAPSSTDDERAERILAAARELLLAWGYKRITVDEIARRARIGKGTVYLHWKTKEVLFTELLRREFHEVLGAVAAGIERDPHAALPGRLVREVFAQQTRRPLARAIHAGDSEVLGALATPRSGLTIAQDLGFRALLTRLVAAWRTHGLVAATASAADQIYTIDAVLSGFVGGGVAVLPDDGVSLDHRAHLLGHTIEAALEPSLEPIEATVRAGAREVLTVLAEAQGALTEKGSRAANS
ncbi:TetR/AcrR family transcriptional regulator [Streptomyces sp. NPDC047081]|uniref:TetR/AcrR family transcriptional regulator n=1 Tax=Streptomyces sp. NPDC047081 TaxID=3154706 RepID=UPI0034104916